MQIKKILVPVDFSDSSRAALEYAQGLAEPFDAQIDVLHVWFTPAYISPSVAVQVAKGETETLEIIAEREAKEQMKAFLESAGSSDGPINIRIEYGYEPTTITTAAEGYDLIVMGTHGRSGVSHLIMGSVAEKVIRHAPCPVLCIRGQALAKS